MKNQLKEKLRNGEVTYGISIGTPCLDIVELASNLAFDWIWFDMTTTGAGSWKGGRPVTM